MKTILPSLRKLKIPIIPLLFSQYSISKKPSINVAISLLSVPRLPGVTPESPATTILLT